MTVENWAGWNPPDSWTLVRDATDVVAVTRSATDHTLRVERVGLGPDDAAGLEQDGWRLSLVADGSDLPTKVFVASFGCRAGGIHALHRAIEAIDETPVDAGPPPDLADVAADLTVRPSPA